MKKFSTLLVLLAALVGLQANAAIYMVGGAKALGNWDPTNGFELTELGEGSGLFMAEDVNIYNGGNDFYFIFTDVIGGWDDVNGSLGEDGEVVNPSHRFSPLEANEQVAIVGTESEHIKTQYSFNGDASYFAPDGVYTIVFDANENEFQLTRQGDAEDDSDPIVVTGSTKIYMKTADPENVYIYAWEQTDNGDGTYGDGGPAFGAWPGTKLTEIEGVSTIEEEGVTYYVATAPFKTIGIVLNNGAGTQSADIKPVTGKIALEYPVEGDFTQYQEIEGPDVPDQTVFVMGQVNGNGWDPAVGVEMTTTDGNEYVLVNAEINGYFGFTLQLGEPGDWDGVAPYRFAAADADNRVLGADAIGVPQALTEPGNNPVDNSFSLPTGTYTLTVNLAARTLVVSGEVVEEPYAPTGELYIIGEVNGNGWSPSVGVKMDKVGEKKFEATVTATADNEGFSYFRFTEKLGTDWDSEFNKYNYACADADPAITEERFGDVIAITEHGHADPSFNIAYNTEFKVTVDLEALTVVFEAAGDAKKGDVNNDGVVNATDLGIIVNIIAGLDDKDNYDGRADLNADGTVNATDLGEVVNIIAGIAE